MPQNFEYRFWQMHPGRQEKIRKCRQKEDQKRSLLAGVLLRHALLEEGIDYTNAVFGENAYGRPVIENTDGIYFSLSHAGACAVCAISDSPIGVDIESADKVLFQNGQEKRLSVLAKKAFSENEYKVFASADESGRNELFLRYWTQKESCSKACGKGMAMDFSKIDTIVMEEKFRSEWLNTDVFMSIYSSAMERENVMLHEITEI